MKAAKSAQGINLYYFTPYKSLKIPPERFAPQWT
jgi:hypothetical protein